MTDQSHLDLKYFIDTSVYNCPYCNRRNIMYELKNFGKFHWTLKKICYFYIVRCSGCDGESFHLTFTELRNNYGYLRKDLDFDSEIFYSVPTSFFVIDDRIPAPIRELITEAEGSLKMNYLTGASACTRKAIYELTVKEKCEGDDYESKIKFLKKKFPEIDPESVDVLSHIQDMASDKVHEQSWPKWDSKNLKLILETLKVVLHEIYVVPDEHRKRSVKIKQLREDLLKDKSSP